MHLFSYRIMERIKIKHSDSITFAGYSFGDKVNFGGGSDPNYIISSKP